MKSQTLCQDWKSALVPAASLKSWSSFSLRIAAVGYLTMMIVLPVSAIVATGFQEGVQAFYRELTNPIAWAALKLTLMVSIITAVINTIMGTLTAYVLVRYDFPARRLLNGLVDLPFAIPTLVTGIMLVVLYGPQGIASAWLAPLGIRIIFAQPGIVLALLLVTFPFVVRSVQPGLMELEKDQEEAAYTLGASKWVTFYRVVLPTVLPAILTGALLTFARAVGEFGSVVVVAGNIPGKTLTAPVHIFGLIESDNPQGAGAVSFVLMGLSFALILAVDWVQQRKETRNVAG